MGKWIKTTPYGNYRDPAQNHKVMNPFKGIITACQRIGLNGKHAGSKPGSYRIVDDIVDDAIHFTDKSYIHGGKHLEDTGFRVGDYVGISSEPTFFFEILGVDHQQRLIECLNRINGSIKFIKHNFLIELTDICVQNSASTDAAVESKTSSKIQKIATSDVSTWCRSAEEVTKEISEKLNIKIDENRLQAKKTLISGAGGPKQSRVCGRKRKAQVSFSHLKHKKGIKGC